jgi:tetratricopeptide (TPR) repeat protein
MIQRLHYITIILLSVFWTAGCAHFSETFTESPGSETPGSGYYLEKADKLIRKDELQIAASYLEIARQLDPGNKKILSKINILKDEIFKKADDHFKKGMAALYRHDPSEARKQFLTVLRYFPEHKAALNCLKNRIHPETHFTYSVQKGDTPQTIAEKVYKNADLAFLVEYFIQSKKQEGELYPSLIHLPVLEKKWIQLPTREKPADSNVKSESDNEKDNPKRALAKQLFEKGNYKKVIAIIQEMVEKNPDDPEVMKLYNYSCYYEGKTLFKKKQFIPAMKMLSQVTMDLKGMDQLKSDLIIAMQNQSEVHYRRGVTFFVNEDLEKAITEWKKTLALAPENQKARKAIENARNLLQKLEGVQ